MSSLVVHHHDVVFRDPYGGIWLTAGIGLWLDELAVHFDEVVLLFFESSSKRKTHDTLLKGQNIRFKSLGQMGNYLDYYSKIRRIKGICRELSGHHDYLLIRGITPMQSLIWHHLKVNKARKFYLVRSPRQERSIGLSITDLIAFVVNKMREGELRSIINEGNRVIANSNQIALDIESEFGVKVPFAPSNVLSSNRIPPFANRPIQEPVKLLYTGRLLAMKGILELIEAAAIFRDEHQLDVEVHLVGQGDTLFVEKLKKRAEDLGLGEALYMPGRVNYGPELFRYYEEADFFVLPTYSEGFPRVYWEAAAHSCPVIITAVGGIPYVVKHEENGILIEPRSASAICNAIAKLVKDPDLCLLISKNAHLLSRNYSLESGVSMLASHITDQE